VKRWLLVALAVVVLGVILVVNLTRSREPSIKARIAQVERDDLVSRITAPGRVQAVSSVDISAEVPGRIEVLSVAEGDSVTKGQLLLQLDDAQYQSRVDQAEAALQSARAGFRLSEARLEKLAKDKDRLEAMFSRDLASPEAVEGARTDYRVQDADLEARRQEVSRAEAAVSDARDNLKKTIYRAPVSGIVSRLNVEAGEIALVGTMNNPGTVILTIADLSLMEVEAEVDETDVVHVAPGQTAEISVDAFPDTTFAGTVITVGSSGRSRGLGTADEAINFEVKVRFDSFDPRLKPGMTADVDIETSTRTDVLAIPIQALVARSRGTLERDLRALARRHKQDVPVSPADSLSDTEKEKWEKEIVEGVYKLVDDKAVFVELVSGIADDTRIEISGEIAEGDRVVSGPYRVLRELKEGTKIEEMKQRGGGQDEDE
jgi:HlyD family secretion protein